MARILVVGMLIVLLAACTSVTGSGNLVTRQFDLDGFSRIDAGHGAQVEVTLGDDFSVDVDVDDNVESMLDIYVSGDTLHIGLDVDSQVNVTFRVKVTMPELTGVTLNGGSSLQGELSGGDLAVSLNGGSSLEGELSGGNLTVNINGGSRATLTGTAGRVTIDVNGGSRAMLGDLAAGDVNLSANGGSHVEVNSSGTVTGSANGGASVTVAGSPASVNVETNGGASVTRK